MPKVRVYYDGSGAIVGIEHRPDETYDDSNAAAYEGKTVTWNVVESAELDVASAAPGGSRNASSEPSVVVSGDARDQSADRPALDAHLADVGNPHHATAAQVGALASNGGTVAGDVTVTGNVSLRGGSALFGTPNDSQTGFGNLQKKNVTLFLTGATQATVGTGAQAVLMIWPVRVGVTGLHIISSTGGVDSMTVGGTARFTGPKIGYVAHTFVNASGRILHTGDVVKLKTSGAVRFHGDRKSTRLNSSHTVISYAVFCLKDSPPPVIYTLSLHDALPICHGVTHHQFDGRCGQYDGRRDRPLHGAENRLRRAHVRERQRPHPAYRRCREAED